MGGERTIGNARDLGGLAVTDGLRILPGRLFRAAAGQLASGEQSGRLYDSGVRVVCDLRSDGERRAAPQDWPPGRTPEIVNLEVWADAGPPGAEFTWERLGTREGVQRFLEDTYRAMPRAFDRAGVRHVVGRLLEREDDALLVNCTQGKDRTGFLIAVLLGAVGVPHEVIVADYLLSNRFVDREKVASHVAWALGPLPDAEGIELRIDPMAFDARAEYLDVALDAMKHDYGSFEGYLRDAAGLDGDGLRRLRSKLVGP